MKAVIQRVTEASVSIDAQVKSEIGNGYLILIGIVANDSQEDIEWLSNKIKNLRLFSDDKGLMNLTIDEVKGTVLVISQFTLHAKTKKGNRPSFIRAAQPSIAIPLYEEFISNLSKVLGKEIASGKFGVDMKVTLCNDGPVTIIIDTKNKN